MPSELLKNKIQNILNNFNNEIFIIFDNKQYTYGDLYTRARFYLNIFNAKNINRNSLFILIIEKSFDYIALVISILLYDCSFLPLDTNNSGRRVENIAKETTAKYYIAKLGSDIDRYFPNSSLLEKGDEIEIYSTGIASKAECRKDIAYVIYTSGSTGKSKGVMLKGASLLNVCKELINRYYIRQSSKVMMFAKISFDSSIAEIFTSLFAQAILVIPQDREISSVNALGKFIYEKKIDVITLPPAIIENIKKEYMVNLTTLISAGELCRSLLAEQYGGVVRYFINAYGPSLVTPMSRPLLR